MDEQSKKTKTVTVPPPKTLPLSIPKAGEIFAKKYQILDEIARGGEGIVYLAFDPFLQRRVAIKILLSGQLASPIQQKRFQRESQILAKLVHPAIVEIHEAGLCEQGYYVVMEYFSAIDLRQFIDENRETLDFARCCGIILQILRGIGYAHQHQIIHRDIKPDNILIQKELLKITDFGIAREINPKSQITLHQGFMGTPLYSSPEQLKGEKVDEQTDLYATGVILYELLTGNHPFTGSFQEICEKIQTQLPPAISAQNPQAPEDLQKIVYKAIHRDKQERYKTAQEFCEDIEKFLRGEPLDLQSMSWMYTKFYLRKYRIVWMSSLATIAIIFIVWGTFSLYGEHLRKQKIKFSYQNNVAKMQHRLHSKETFPENLQEIRQHIELLETTIYGAKQMRDNMQMLSTQDQQLLRDQLANIITNAETKKQPLLQYKIALENELQNSLQLARDHILQGNRQKALEILLYIQKKDQSNETIAEFIKNAQTETVEITLSVVPKNSEVRIYKIASDKKIATIPYYQGTTQQTIYVPSFSHYLIFLNHNGYIPCYIMLNVDDSTKNLQQNLILQTPKYHNMVHIVGHKEVFLGSKSRLRYSNKMFPEYGILQNRSQHLRENYQKVSVTEFLIDRYEVTNRQYFQYLEDSRSKNIPEFWKNKKYDSGKKNYPITNISWSQAREYALFYRKDLPTNEQWEFAARGIDERKYPWGDSDLHWNNAKIACLDYDFPTEVGSLSDVSPFKIQDLAGNVSEWTRTMYVDKFAIIRGGCFRFPQQLKKYGIADWWQTMPVESFYDKLGFRCVVDLPDKNK